MSAAAVAAKVAATVLSSEKGRKTAGTVILIILVVLLTPILAIAALLNNGISFDTSGLVVREAAACGLASVLIKDSCAAEGITDDRNGFIIEESAQDMAELLMKACEDLDHVHDVGQHAMDEIYMSWSDCVAKAYERYQYVFTRPDTQRARTAQEMLALWGDEGAVGIESPEVALTYAQEKAKAEDAIFIGGSNYLVGYALSRYSYTN